jgi:hypothetical protein
MSPLALLLSLTLIVSAYATPPPEYITRFTAEFCINCHGPDKQKGDFRIDRLLWNLTEAKSHDKWKLVLEYIADGDMPPKKAEKHPGATDQSAFLQSLEADLAQAELRAPVGGTLLRRLNRVEYLNTVRDLFGIRMIKLPLSFPSEATTSEFDTMPEGLFLSPAVMQAYYETATDLADRIVPLLKGPSYRSEYVTETIGGDENRRWFGPRLKEISNKFWTRQKTKEYLLFTGFNNSGWTGLFGTRS